MLKPIQYINFQVPRLVWNHPYLFMSSNYIVVPIRAAAIQIRDRTESAIKSSFRKKKWYQLNLGRLGGPK